MTPWGTVELEPEVDAWFASLDDGEFGQAAFCLDLLEQERVLLDEPYTRQLDGKLRELRFYVRGRRQWITYCVVTDRRIILLTVFAKTAPREAREIARAKRAMLRCISEGHTAEED